MKAFRIFGMVAAVGLCSVSSHAQFVKGNEAVRQLPGGGKAVETPPISATAGKLAPCSAAGGCHVGVWHMVETTSGLRECTEPYARASSCRDSTYGRQKLSRLWVAKTGEKWLWCQYPDLSKKCVDMHARPPMNLPVSAVQ